MAEETYQEVVDKIKDDEGEKDNVKDVNEETKKCELIAEEENEDSETTDLGLETKQVEKVAMIKKQPACRAKLRDKVTCPKCDKELSRHSYEYTHAKFCKGRPPKPPQPSDDEEEEDEDVREITKKMEQMTVTELLEETKPRPKAKAKAISKPQKVENIPSDKDIKDHVFVKAEAFAPTDDDIKKYLSNIRKEKAMRKQQGYDKLIRTAF
jgi:hypothetical protein